MWYERAAMPGADASSRCDDAVVLALPVPGAAPLDRLAGLSLALRTVLTLQKEGARRVVLVVPEGDRAIHDAVRADRRVRITVEARPASSARDALAALGGELSGPVLVARHDVVVDPAVYRALRGEAASLEPSGPLAVVAVRGTDRLGPFVAHPALASELTAESLDLTLTQLLAEGRARAHDVGSAFAFRVTTPEGRALAFRALFEACRKPVDGVVARHVNRHISIFISKRLVNTPLTPNMMSVFTFLLGIAGAVSVAQGGYLYTLLGAFLFQWNSILDGVDGELARVRFQHSTLGQWLDTVSDDASNLIFYAGLSIGALGLPFGRWLALAGWVGIVASALATVQYYVELVRVGSGDLYAIEWDFDKAPPAGVAGKLLIFFRYVVKKDFALLFFLALAVLGVLPYALPIIAGGAIGTLVAATLRNVKRMRAKAAAAPAASLSAD
jgi:phosphatidylglycerophosphate synthase